MDIARNHVALVFHRLLNPEKKTSPLVLSINSNPVKAVDPFLSSNKATQVLPQQEFTVCGEAVRVAPFILPHISKLSAADLELAGGEEGLRRNQGFYVYRNLRLISWGSWYHPAGTQKGRSPEGPCSGPAERNTPGRQTD
jgi:hypothetical protein